MPRDSYERDIPAAVQASDFGLTDAEVSTSLDGFTKVIDVDLIFDTESISVDQLKQSLALVSEGLSASPSSRLIIAFYGPDQELLPGFEEVTNSLNDELQLGGYARMDGELGMLGFNPLSDLHDLVAKFGEG